MKNTYAIVSVMVSRSYTCAYNLIELTTGQLLIVTPKELKDLLLYEQGDVINVKLNKTRATHTDVYTGERSYKSAINKSDSYYISFVPSFFNSTRYTTIDAETGVVYQNRAVLVGLTKEQAKIIYYDAQNNVYKMQVMPARNLLAMIIKKDCVANIQCGNDKLIWAGADIWETKTTIEKQKITEDLKDIDLIYMETYNMSCFREENKSSFILEKYPKKGKTDVLSIPRGITVIGQSAFQNIEADVVVLPNSIRKISPSAFRYAKIGKIVIPESCIEIGADAFMLAKIQNLVISEGLIALKAGAFRGAEIGNVVQLPATLRLIEANALAAKQGLFKLAPYGLLEMNVDIFYSDNVVLNTSLPQSVRTIYGNVYFDRKTTQSICIDIPEHTVLLEANFTGIRAKEVLVRMNRTTPYMFKNSVMTTLYLDVPYIDENTFNNCYALRHVYVSGNVDTVKAGAFARCNPNLEILPMPNDSNAIVVAQRLNELYAKYSLFKYKDLDNYERAKRRARKNEKEGRMWRDSGTQVN